MESKYTLPQLFSSGPPAWPRDWGVSKWHLTLYFQDEDDDEGEDKLDSDFDMNKMLNQLRIDENGKEKGIEDFDDLDDEDSDDEGTGCLFATSQLG